MAYTTIDDPSEYFHINHYTGSGSSGLQVRNSANAGTFTPDWLWIKPTSLSDNHTVFDSTRGFDKQLKISTDDEDTHSPARITRETNGFDVDTTDQNYNQSSATYAAWQWKVNNGTRTTFTESGANPGGGHQANTTAGFSIVDYTGTGSAGTVSHGLGAVPKVLIVKNRDATTDWAVYHRNASSAGNDSYLELNTTDAVATAGTVWNDTSPSSSVFTVGTNTKTNTDGEKYIAYCLTPIQGYSKFGSYTGNGNADGPFIYTGFKPAWLLFKQTNASGENWRIFDNKRSPFNQVDDHLFASSNSVENDETGCDFLSNGFKWKNSDAHQNGNGATYLYMAFAEHPFVSSKGVPVTAR